MQVIAGTARRLQLVTAPGLETRPTQDRIKETLFNILMPYVQGSRFLDLFSGSGAIGIEALSRGAREAVFVENNRNAIRCIRQNLEHTHLSERASVMECEVRAAIRRLEQKKQAFDLIFLDPPYDGGYEPEILRMLAEGPLLDEHTLVIVEARLTTSFDFVSEQQLPLELVREKCYKSNKHVFFQLKRNDHES